MKSPMMEPGDIIVAGLGGALILALPAIFLADFWTAWCFSALGFVAGALINRAAP